jgi:hypothetical protein
MRRRTSWDEEPWPPRWLMAGPRKGHNGSQRGRVEPTATNEWHGATYQMVLSDQQQAGDPLSPHGVPPGYEHPQPLGPDVLDPGGPRILPVSQEVQHGPELSRSAEFDAAMREAAELGAYHASIGFYDRRFEGRRHRAGYLYEDPEPAPPRGGWQRDYNTMERLNGF